MTEFLDRAVERARRLAPDMQDEIARIVLTLAGEDSPLVQLDPDEKASLTESMAQADRREFASDETIRAIWAKHGL